MSEPIRYQNDDAGYLAWREAHPEAWVANVDAGLRSYLKVHRASCRFAAFTPRAAIPQPLTGGQYVKVVAPTFRELRRWAERQGFAAIARGDALCGSCCRDVSWAGER